nr:uncharacterized protein LOC117987161 [Maniola hyperantus]
MNTTLDRSCSDSDIQASTQSVTTPPKFISMRNKRKRDEDIAQEFNSFKEEVRKMLSTLMSSQENEFKKNASTLKEIQRTNTNIENSLAFLSAQNEEFRKKIESLEGQIKEDKKYITIMEDKIEEVQRDSRKTNLELKNVPKKNNESKEDLMDMVMCLSNNIDCKINKSDIRDIYRIRSKKEGIQNTPIIVETSSTILKNDIIKMRAQEPQGFNRRRVSGRIRGYCYHRRNRNYSVGANGVEGGNRHFRDIQVDGRATLRDIDVRRAFLRVSQRDDCNRRRLTDVCAHHRRVGTARRCDTVGAPAVVEASAIEQGRSQAREASAIQKRRRTVKPQEVPLPPSKKGEGSTHSRSKAHRIAKAKEELLRLQVELAAARIAAMEAEETEDEIEDDGASVHSGAETSERVGNWLESQPPRPALAITSEPHYPIEPVVNSTGQQKHQNPLQSPAGVQPGLTELAEAITLAVKAARRPKFIELPIFGGSHQEWLPFRAAYYETESMFTTIENTNRLRRNLKGRAKEAVEGLLITSAHPTEVMKTLESRFGRPESIAMMEIEALRGLPRLTESPRDICIFSTKVSNVVATLKTLSCVNYMFNPEVSKTVVDKLTPTLRYRYYDFAVLQPKEDPDLMKMEKFLKREAELCGPYALPEQVAPHTSHAPATQQRRPQKIHNVTEKQYTPKCAICEGEHGASDCEQFKNADANGRWDIAKSKRLCFRCLRYRNRTHNCRVKACGVNSCKYFHHKMLHYTKTPEKKEGVEITEIINSAWTIQKKQSYLKIIPVQVEGPKGALNTFALMDDGSTVTLIDNSIAELIGATGPIDPLKIETINDMKTSESASRRVNIKLRGLNDHEERIQARTVKNLQVSSQRVSRELVDGCTHLADIRDYLVYADIKPRVLIGQDNWHLLLTTEVRRGNSNQPVASLTPLGWVLHGSQSRAAGRSIDFVSHVTEGTEDDLDSLVKQYFEMDALCIQPKKPKTDPEEQALRILEKTTTKQEDGRYETGLLWCKEDVTFPDNYNNSLKRLHNIEKKIDRDPKLKQKYTEQMEALISKGYAELAPKQKTAGKTWYLPHFAVINPMKPEKLRVVHDAAAKTKGVALNDMLLKGPDLLQSLPGVIMRFRQHAVAVTADIKEMFMQVKLRAEDRDALRYLWRGERRDSQPPEEYRMTSLIFGASSSPSTAIYIKNLNAEQHKEAHPEAAAAIVQKHYVDDYLDSFRNLEEAVRITN